MNARQFMGLTICCLLLSACTGDGQTSPTIAGGQSTVDQQRAPVLPAARSSTASSILAELAKPANRLHLGNSLLVMRALGVKANSSWRAIGQLAQPSSEQVVVFDAPGASSVPYPGCTAYCGTFVAGISDSGVVVGSYNDSNVVAHGFIRSPSGAVESFDAPGAGNQTGIYQGTFPWAINDAGIITGNIQTSANVFHAFIRDANGNISFYDVPGAGTGAFQGTIAQCINQHGDTAGYYYDQNNAAHAYVRKRNGTLTTFDAPGAILTFTTDPMCLTEAGDVAGTYYDAAGNGHAYVRRTNGTVVTVDPPNHGPAVVGNAISNTGIVVGAFLDDSGLPPPGAFHGFVRNPNGTFVQLDVPGGVGTDAHSVNQFGTVAGEYFQHPFVRSRKGAYVEYLVPGTAGAYPLQINFHDTIAGNGYEGAPLAPTINHGYIASPGL